MLRFDELSKNYSKVLENVERAAIKTSRTLDDITIVAATKTISYEEISMIKNLGVDAVGENRVQELCSKYDDGIFCGVPLHFIGNLQTNKVKYLISKVDLIQSVNSIKLMNEIEKCANKRNIRQKILIEVNIADESTKKGISKHFLEELMENATKMSNIDVCGLMAMLPNTDDLSKKFKYLQQIHQLFVDISQKKYDNISMDFLSVGMSGDYYEAILSGANMVRIGSAIFEN